MGYHKNGGQGSNSLTPPINHSGGDRPHPGLAKRARAHVPAKEVVVEDCQAAHMGREHHLATGQKACDVRLKSPGK